MFSHPPPQGQGRAGQDSDSTMQLAHYTLTASNLQQPMPALDGGYASFITDHAGYQYPMAVYPITKNFAAKEMQGMERNLVTKSDWIPEGLHVVQKAIEEVNEKDRVVTVGYARASRSGDNNGYGDNDSGSGAVGMGDACWELSGFRYDGTNEWNQIALLLEKVMEE